MQTGNIKCCIVLSAEDDSPKKFYCKEIAVETDVILSLSYD